MLGILFGFFSLWGWNVVWFVALQDLTPVSHDVCCPLFLFHWLFGMFADAVFFFLAFSFSQALGKPKPRLGFGIPLVSLHHERALRPRSVLRAPHLHSGHAPHLFFFFVWVVIALGTVVVGCVCGGGWLFSACLGCGGPLSPVCFLHARV